jgi:hypothetical protein
LLFPDNFIAVEMPFTDVTGMIAGVPEVMGQCMGIWWQGDVVMMAA